MPETFSHELRHDCPVLEATYDHLYEIRPAEQGPRGAFPFAVVGRTGGDKVDHEVEIGLVWERQMSLRYPIGTH